MLGAWLDATLKERDRTLSSGFRFIPVIDFTRGKRVRLVYRARSKVANLWHRFARVETNWQLGYAYREQRYEAFAQDADLYIAHHEQAMAVAIDLMRAGRPVALDMEDWFSEDLTGEVRKQRPLGLLRSLEKKLLLKGRYCSCPSRSMRDALVQEYRCVAPAIIYNSFSLNERSAIDGIHKDRSDLEIVSIHWFSQTLGEGRGLEDLLAALGFLRSKVEIHLRGQAPADFESWLSSRVPAGWRSRIFVHPQVPNNELLSRIAEHDIGFAGEMKWSRSRNLTITNKILQYLLGGLAVIASDTAGQREVAEKAPGAVVLYPSGNAQALAKRIDELVQSATALTNAKQAALRSAHDTFCWERQEHRLLELVDRAVSISY